MEYLIIDKPIRTKKERRIRYRVIGKGNKCNSCSKEMQRREHLEKPSKIYFYEKWDFCTDCKYVKHYEEFKNPQWKESERLQEHFKSI